MPWAWLAAAALLLACVWLAGQLLRARSDREALETSRALALAAREMAEIRLAERTLLAERAISELGRKLQQQEDVTRLAAARLETPGSAGVRVLVIWHRDLRTGLALVESLPPLPEDQDYQLWAQDSPGRPPVRCGLLAPPTGAAPLLLPFAADQATGRVSGFLLSRERKGGSREPTGGILASAPVPEL